MLMDVIVAVCIRRIDQGLSLVYRLEHRSFDTLDDVLASLEIGAVGYRTQSDIVFIDVADTYPFTLQS